MRSWAFFVFVGLLGIAVLVGLWELGAHVLFEWRVVYGGDVYYFMTVGRGILNGLLPYIDLFETKPPGIFWLSAVSLGLTGTMSIAHVAQIAVIVLLPVVVVVSAWPIARQEVGLFACTILFALVISLYVAHAAGTLYPESFGAFFVVLYACILHVHGEKWSRYDTTISAACILFALLMKEPFGLSIVVVGLLLAYEPRHIFERLVFPFVAALMAGGLLLQLAGYAEGYMTMYLPFMSSSYFESPAGPVWLQGFYWYKLVMLLFAVSPALPIAIGAVVLFPLFREACPLSRGRFAALIFLLIVALSCAPIALALGAYWFVVLAAMLLLMVGFLWYLVSDAFREARFSSVWRLSLFVLVLYLVVLLPGTRGQFLPHHGVFSVPMYVALFLLTLDGLAKAWESRVHRVLTSGWAVMLAAVLLTYNTPPFTSIVESSLKEEVKMRAIAAVIDDVLDRCTIDRYLLLGPIDTGVAAYTKHSPLGPGFNQEKFNILVPQFRQKYVENIRTASFALVLQPVLMPDEAAPAMREYVTTPPSCAANITPPEGMSFYFRRVGSEP